MPAELVPSSAADGARDDRVFAVPSVPAAVVYGPLLSCRTILVVTPQFRLLVCAGSRDRADSLRHVASAERPGINRGERATCAAHRKVLIGQRPIRCRDI